MMTPEFIRELLPKNATKLERAVAGAVLSHLDDIPHLLDMLWDPQGCPEELLPWLAWALSVDVWREDWPVQTKRDVLSATSLVHRRKGVVAAVERAISAFGLDTEVVEWWQTIPAGRRGTFRIEIRPGENAKLDGDFHRMMTDVKAFVTASKPKSRPFDINVGLDIRAARYAGVFSFGCRFDSGTPRSEMRLQARTRSGVAVFGLKRNTETVLTARASRRAAISLFVLKEAR